MSTEPTYLINRAQISEECPQGLKPDFLGLQMSEPFATQGELKLRPSEIIYVSDGFWTNSSIFDFWEKLAAPALGPRSWVRE